LAETFYIKFEILFLNNFTTKSSTNQQQIINKSSTNQQQIINKSSTNQQQSSHCCPAVAAQW
jgi:hypothetical protein